MASSKTSSTPSHDVAELLDPVKVALLLGAEIPALEYMSVYALVIMWLEPDSNKKLFKNTSVSIFDTKENAERSLSIWVQERWKENPTAAPWYLPVDSVDTQNSKQLVFLKSHSHQEIIDAFFLKESTSNTYQILKREVLGFNCESTEG